MFQFYKVRLKAQATARFSFPQSRFQFYKVRLKAISIALNISYATWFQFYKVRLKVFAIGRVLASICGFNSIKFD